MPMELELEAYALSSWFKLNVAKAPGNTYRWVFLSVLLVVSRTSLSQETHGTSTVHHPLPLQFEQSRFPVLTPELSVLAENGGV